jgi:hypothetical protein
VSAAGVVPAFDVLEYGLADSYVRRPWPAVQQFGFDGREERLGDRVVPALPTPADREPDAVAFGEAGVLRS